MYDIDPKPNSDQTYCSNCECIIDKLNIIETINGKSGCTECISNCAWCGDSYFWSDMKHNPYFGWTCQSCVNGEESQKATEQEVIKEALRCYFDKTEHKGIEQIIIQTAKKMGFLELAQEMKNDIK